MSFGKATNFEFRHRRWFIIAIIAAGFAANVIDRISAARGLLNLLKGGNAMAGAPVSRGEIQAVFLAAALLATAAAVIRTWGTAYLGAAVMQDSRIHSDQLLAGGPYRFVRNPLYFGTVLMAAGIGLYASRLGWFVIVFGILIFLSRLIRREESELEQTQGESFQAYCSKVPRFWPSLWPRLPASGRKPRFAQAFWGELLMWGLAAASFVFAWSLNAAAFYIVFGAAILTVVVQRRAKKPAPVQNTTPHLILFFLCALLGPGLSGARAASGPIEYQIDLRSPAFHRVRVTMTVVNAAPGIRLQFPAWNALYQIRDFVRNVQQLQAKCGGAAMDLVPLDLETWRSRNEPCNPLTVSYSVYSNAPGIFSSQIIEQRAFLNLADFLFYLPDQRARPVKVRILLPEGWKMATLLPVGPEPNEILAANYDTLVDSPVEAGDFQSYQYQQGAATYRVMVRAHPEDYSSKLLLDSIEQITATETALMQDVPFNQYTFIFHFPRQGGGGGMEHADGTAISFPAARIKTNWVGLESTIAHEFFHLWNVKRIRPQGLEPVDYVHGNDTRDLWFSEGLTSTYGELALERSRLISKLDFYNEVARQIQELQSRPARRFQSAELSGMEAWLEKYPDYFRPERSISYYNKGELLGFLLDLGIRHASGNRHSLDDVMRRLNADFAKRDRCFTDADLETIMGSLSGSPAWVHQFFRDDVDGTAELDYQTYLSYAGLQLKQQPGARADFGFRAERASDGLIRIASVNANGEAAKAGLKPGDVLLKIDGQNLVALPENVTGVRPDHHIKFTVRRSGETFDVKYRLGSIPVTAYQIEEMTDASPAQVAIREGWLTGKTALAAAPDSP